MSSPEAADRWGARPITALPIASSRSTAAAVARAFTASTVHRVRRGEGALLAVNLSVLAHRGLADLRNLTELLVSILAIGLMYAFNDLYDAPSDLRNPKKDRDVVSIYIDHRRVSGYAIIVLSLVTVALAFFALGPRVTLAVSGCMLVNVVYSRLFKHVPVADVAWCGLWGILYAAIVIESPWALLLVGLMTAVCHLYQALDDREPDTANAITTIAVRSPALSRDALIALSIGLFLVLRGPLGDAWALTAFTPLPIYFAFDDAYRGWILTKVYFGVLWLYLLGFTRAVG